MYKNIKGFTLIELIIVITILAILGTISFFSYLGYTSDARNLVRIYDINKIEKSLGVYITLSGKYPKPTEWEAITYSGSNIWLQGTFGDKTFTNVRVMSKIPLDPVTGSEYVYSVSGHRLEYEVSGAVEGDVNDFQALNLVNKTFALGRELNAYVVGTYNGIVSRVNISGSDYVLALPSITSTNIVNKDINSLLS